MEQRTGIMWLTLRVGHTEIAIETLVAIDSFYELHYFGLKLATVYQPLEPGALWKASYPF